MPTKSVSYQMFRGRKRAMAMLTFISRPLQIPKLFDRVREDVWTWTVKQHLLAIGIHSDFGRWKYLIPWGRGALICHFDIF